MAVSILHRMTGSALALAGLPILTWWLLSIADGPQAYARFTGAATHPAGLLVLIGLTWALIMKTLAGIRHLVMDSGSGFEIQGNKRWAILTIVGSLLLTLLVWLPILGVRL